MLSPDVAHPHVLLAFNAPSLAKFGPAVVPGGVVLYDSTVVREVPALPPSVRLVPVPCSEIARAVGEPRVKNVVALGALQRVVPLLPAESLLAAIRQALGAKGNLVPLNEEAFRRGAEAAAGSAPA